jgi:hypothetical protein
MKRYHMLYTDSVNFKANLTIDTNLELKDGQKITVTELEFDLEKFFEDKIGYTFNPAYDHNTLEVIGECIQQEGVYLMQEGEMLPQDFMIMANNAKQFIYNVAVKDSTYALHHYRGFWITEAINPKSFALYWEGKHPDMQISTAPNAKTLTDNIDAFLDGEKATPAAVEETQEIDTAKYLVAYIMKSEIDQDNNPDRYKTFIEYEQLPVDVPAVVDEDDPELIIEEATVKYINGKSPKEQAEDFYYKLLEDPDIYTANLCRIVASTDYF